jgi:hypothetical protein
MTGMTNTTKAAPLTRSLLINLSLIELLPLDRLDAPPSARLEIRSEPAEKRAWQKVIVHADLDQLDVRIDGRPDPPNA